MIGDTETPMPRFPQLKSDLSDKLKPPTLHTETNPQPKKPSAGVVFLIYLGLILASLGLGTAASIPLPYIRSPNLITYAIAAAFLLFALSAIWTFLTKHVEKAAGLPSGFLSRRFFYVYIILSFTMAAIRLVI